MLGFFGVFSGLGNKVKLLITVIVSLAVIAGSITAIVLITLNLTESLDRPYITLTENVASWEANENAREWELRLNGEHSRVDKSTTTVTLNEGDVLCIRAIGSGVFSNSDWSNVVKYEKESLDTYTVTWKNFNGDVLLVDTDVSRGTVPCYSGDVPTKPADERYSYTFSGWTPDIHAIESDATYFASFSEVLNNYSVEFCSEDGTELLDTVTVAYGAAAVYTKSAPQKSQTASHIYTFAGWVTAIGGSESADLNAVSQNIKVYASFTETLRCFNVTVISSSTEYGTVSVGVVSNVPYGTDIVIEGSKLSVNGTDAFAVANSESAEYKYSFTGWTKSAEKVITDLCVTANFERVRRAYTVIWKNTDGTVLETDEAVEYGTVPSYNGAIPEHPQSPDGLYVFEGAWSPDVTEVTGNAVYIARYTRNENLRQVTFYADDGETVIGYCLVNVGESAVFTGTIPGKPSTLSENYTFDKWVNQKGGTSEASLVGITEDISVYASFTSEAREYTIVFKNTDGELLHSSRVKYGEAKAALTYVPVKAGYTLSPWNTAPDGSGMSFESVTAPDEVLFSKAVDETVTLYGEWQANEYTVIYNANKPLNASGEVESLSSAMLWIYDTDCTLASAPSIIGWTFEGWYRDAACTEKVGSADETLSEPNLATSGEVALYAAWTPKTYTVTYDANGGEGIVAQSHHVYDEPSPLSANGFTKTDCVFLGWSKDQTAVSPEYSDVALVGTLSENDVTLYAVWLKTKQTVSYSDEVTILKGDPYSETLDPQMNLQALISAGYTHIKISVVLYGKRTALDSDMLSYSEIILQDHSYVIMSGTYLDNRAFEEQTYYKEFAIYDFGGSSCIELNCYTSGTPASSTDGWILGERTITLEAMKK